ncbi:efflux RND transporter periplasmic adaptor subunit [Tunturibacter empetritectus]|uniref:Multidrug efflux pump subunit AcrA (Membrane-fusion protein) n=1 Tax=Tunturiibacter empetritectus TaxID=3069691 RepID=A0A7W8IN62_9BACT|nr:efflux RND transporter periplasmic adaptor subunit [Edaphobacter lichenicola]MBB5319238.1 multidrug efflux pump subunit AcrA (membrane-fusion protein) [Edaphobacter lichenicola]
MANKMVTTTTQRAGTPALAASLMFLSASMLLQNGCKKADDTADKPVVTVQAVHPGSGSITEEIDADATLAPVAQAAILPKVTAPVRKFYVQRGDHVKADQLVATLENEDLAAAAMDNKGAFDAAQGAYATATQSAVPEEQTRSRLDLEQAKATLDLDNSILEARKQLLSQGAIPGRDYDTARTTALQAQAAYDIAKQRYEALSKVGTSASLESAKGTLASAKGKYLGAQAQLSYTNIRTPISGVVTDRPLFAGETAAAGTPVVTVMDTSAMIAKLHIAQIQAQRLSVGSAATITVPGIEEPIDAKVSLISPALDPGSTTVEVWLRVPNPKGKLKAGTTVHATLKGRTVENALLIPTEAVQRSPEGAGKIVMVVGADGAAAKRAVTVGIQTDESAQILSGLKPSDMVITTGGYGLDEGTKVKVGPAEEKGSAGKSDDDAGGKE